MNWSFLSRRDPRGAGDTAGQGAALVGYAHALSVHGHSRRVAIRIAAALCAAAALMALWSASASAALVHPFVSSFGSFSSAVRGVAVDQSSGDVYVYDSTGKAIYKFNESGAPAEFTWTKTNEITGLPTAASGRGELAVDNSSGPAKGDIYVAHGSSSILIYNTAGEKAGEITGATGGPWGTDTCGVAVDPEGNVYVAVYAFGAGDIDKFAPAASPAVNGDYSASIGGVRKTCNLAADSKGNVFADTWTSGPVTRYEPSQFGSTSATGSVVDKAGTTLAIDPADDDVYVDEQSQVSQFGRFGEPFEEPVMVFAGSGEGAISGSQGIAVDATGGDIYVSNGDGAISVFGPPVLRPTVTTGRASSLAAETATVSGEVNPEGLPIEECYFEYGELLPYASRAACVEEPTQIGEGTKGVKVHADLTGLTAGVTYHYRLVANNENGPSAGEDATFEFVKPVIEDEWANGVSASGATLEGSFNPKGSITEYWFEYGPTEGSGSLTPIETTGEETSQLPIRVHIQGLSPETAYHYRLVAASSAGSSEGPVQAFTTQGPGGPLTLLDGRQWELVSPPVKHGAGIFPQRSEGDVIAASASGDAISYITKNPIETEPEGNSAPEASQIIARRSAGGAWVNRTLDTANEDIHQLPSGVGLEYKAFSEDLSRSILQPYGTTPLSPSATKERAPYLREEGACQEGLSPCFTPFLTRDNTMPGAEWDPNPPDAVPGLTLEVNFRGATSDLKHAVVSSGVQLLEGAEAPDLYGFNKAGLYEFSSDGQLQFVSINAAGEPAPGAFAGSRNAISADGSRIIWCEATCTGRTPLLMRDTATGETLTIAAGSEETTFQAANEDDSKIFYTTQPVVDERQLWECEVVEGAGGKLECAATEIAPETEGFIIGINEAANTVYFVSTAALNGEAEAGAYNLYVANREAAAWQYHFITALSGDDGHDWGWGGSTSRGLVYLTAAVSSNGRYLTFMSDRSLTGYDNHDAVSGEPDQEVYLYDAQTTKFVCASCNMTGARPHGMYLHFDDGTLANSARAWHENWVAATTPGWEPPALGEEGRRQPRYLSDEGRVFFSSSDDLVPQDTNGLWDVYEYEPEGTGSCSRAEGCVGLVSSGKSGEESAFLEASASGDNVFFITTGRLVPEDEDTAFDVYDAHICTSAEPCTQSAVAPAPCSNGEACKPPQSPQPSIFGAPATATFSGSGNATPTPPSSGGHQKGMTRKQKLHRALKKCRRRHARSKRKLRQCRRRARSRYGKAAHRSDRHRRRGHAAHARRSPHHGSTENRRGR